MPPISMKKVIIFILLIVMLSKLDRIIVLSHGIYEYIYDSFEPLRGGPMTGRYVGVLMLLALAYVTIVKLLLEWLRNRK